MRTIAYFAVVALVAYLTVGALRLFHVYVDEAWLLVDICIGALVVLWIYNWTHPPKPKGWKIWYD